MCNYCHLIGPKISFAAIELAQKPQKSQKFIFEQFGGLFYFLFRKITRSTVFSGLRTSDPALASDPSFISILCCLVSFYRFQLVAYPIEVFVFDINLSIQYQPLVNRKTNIICKVSNWLTHSQISIEIWYYFELIQLKLKLSGSSWNRKKTGKQPSWTQLFTFFIR